MVDVLRSVHLLDDALTEHGDAIGHAHRLDLVVRDIDERPAEVALEPLQLCAHLEAEQGVECGQGLVEQERARVPDERAPERDPLTLAARQLRRLALEQVLDMELGRCLADSPRDLGLRHLRLPEGERQVVVDRLVGVKSEVLEHDRDVPVPRIDVRDALAVEVDVALVRPLETDDRSQQRGLAGTGGAEDREELPVRDLQADSLQRGDGAEALGDLVESDRCHQRTAEPLARSKKRRNSGSKTRPTFSPTRGRRPGVAIARRLSPSKSR